jgi:hypothetical protein
MSMPSALERAAPHLAEIRAPPPGGPIAPIRIPAVVPCGGSKGTRRRVRRHVRSGKFSLIEPKLPPVTYTLSSKDRNGAQERFRTTGGPPPPGVAMIARWHCAQGLKGFVIAETSDAEALARWLQEWSDLLSFEATPVLSDEQMMRVIG